MNSYIHDYLWHGYVPPRDVPEWFTEALTQSVAQGAEYSLEGAAKELDKLFDNLVPKTNGPHLVPLSGGWDSRLVLGALMERAEDVQTISLGARGQLDYEVGRKISRSLNLTHHKLDLSDFNLNWEDLIHAASIAPWIYMPDALFMNHMYEKGIEKSGARTIWSGFLGEALTGGHYQPSHSHETLALAQKNFARSQRKCPDNLLSSHELYARYPDMPFPLYPVINCREFLDLNIRQRGCVAKIALGHDWTGWNSDQGNISLSTRLVAPFTDEGWARYWLNAPRKHHERQQLYRQMAEYRFPKLFRLPSKYSWGAAPSSRILQSVCRFQFKMRNKLHARFPFLPIGSNLKTNYIDFQRAFRKREDYIIIAHKAINYLMEWDKWLADEFEGALKEHKRGSKDNHQALLILVGLSANLCANA